MDNCETVPNLILELKNNIAVKFSKFEPRHNLIQKDKFRLD